jgi:phosphoribosyl 1,2-cyclic phosphate phosphodiesterase
MKLVVLGSGTSTGIPVIGCTCRVCTSPDPKDKRLRASLYIKGDSGARLVIDTGPDFRTQALRAGITRLDAVLLTHDHADHLHGFDDVRPLSWRRVIPVYGNAVTVKTVYERFSYIFHETQRGGGKPRVDLRVQEEPLRIGNLTLIPVPVKHGILDILGWIICEDTPEGRRRAAYLTDTSFIPENSMKLLRAEGGPETLIIDGLRERPHETHFSFAQAIQAGLDMGAKGIYLTHICHDKTHAEIEEYCEKFAASHGLACNMHAAYDGMEILLD